jgi:dipeptidyl aminopeptidase/acylaminoacyl peptidase
VTDAPCRIPLEDFFRNPERESPRLSPDGRRLAFLAPVGRRMNVFVRDLGTDEEQQVTFAESRDIQGYVWAGSERIVFAQDTGGDENYRLYAVDHDGGNRVDLTPIDDVKCGIVDDLEEVPDEILFQMNDRDPQLFDVYRLNVRTAERTLVAENPGTIRAWITDHAGRVRTAWASDGVNTSVLYRESEDDEWSVLSEHDFKETLTPVGFSFDDRLLWAASNVGRDKTAIVEIDPETGGTVRVLFERSDVDVSRLLTSRQRKVITAGVYVTDRTHYEFFDDERREIQTLLDDRLPGRENSLVSYSRDESRYVVLSDGDRAPGSYWLLEAATGELTFLFECMPWLDEDELAPVRPIEYASRDGLTIHGYLTLPKGLEAQGLPLLVMPHGGPWHRDTWGYDPLLQFFANRGMAVLQMNFRGSTEYGRAFWEASFGQWGLAMQDDVTDGVAWAVSEGIADPSRVGIFGGSYGGYAVLSGLTKTPDVYACGISYVGVSNLFTWIEAFPPYWEPLLEMVHEMVGHPERDEERWRATSPFFQADNIRVPLLVAQGANDPRVRKEESDQIVEACRERGIDVEYIVKDDEGHGFQNEENQLELYAAVERFLGKHLQLES